MNQIEKLIEELCPDGVEYKPLGEVGTFSRGGGVQKKDFTESGIGCIHYGQIYTHYGISATETKSFVSSLTFSKAKKAQPGDIIIADTSENDEDLCKAVAWLGEDSVAVSNHTLIFTTELNPKFVSYFLRSLPFQKQKRKFVFGTKVRSISGTNMGKILLPCPPLEIQQEIVKILDTFQSLEAELEAELEARKKQIGFYRDTLIHTDSHPLIKFEDIAEFRYGLTATAQETGSYRFLRITDIDGNGKIRNQERKFLDRQVVEQKYVLSPGDLLIARTGASYGKCAITEGEEQAVYASFLIRMKVDEEIANPRFVWHFMQSNHYWQQANFLVSKAGQPQFNANAIKRVTIPVPPLEEQQRIVNILDKFDALVNDLTSGLPAEIEARRKQYEYYRDQLLTFKELSA
ncbi:restriction endonuclease subunit S [Corynebacterium amycolatum]|uniref:restriction endonuclease subunit S n=1 Tax=Corynebacterium amycolatum TaxID=43765 RepID=UPI003AF87BDB